MTKSPFGQLVARQIKAVALSLLLAVGAGALVSPSSARLHPKDVPEVPAVLPGIDKWHAPFFDSRAPLPELNIKIINFAVEHLGQQVGNGECWTLAREALDAAGAQPPDDYVFGRELATSESWLPGDVIQFTSCRFVEVTPYHKTTSTVGAPNHTAIIHSVQNGLVVILQQNVNGDRHVQTEILNFNNLVKGSFKVYRPVPLNSVQFGARASRASDLDNNNNQSLNPRGSKANGQDSLARASYAQGPSVASQQDGKPVAMTDEVRGMCQEAEGLINARKFREAEQLLDCALKIDPNCPEVHGYLGMTYQNSQRTQKAIEEYLQALQLNPAQMSFIKINLGTCYMNMNQPDQAVPYFEQYLQENPNGPDAAQARSYIQQAGSRRGQLNLRQSVESGRALLNQHKYREACSAFEQAIAQQPNFAPAHFFYGYALGQSGQNQRAIGEFQTALQLDPGLKDAVVNIGSNYQSLGDCANAIFWYERFLHENPGSPKAGEIQQRISGLRQQLSKQGPGRGGGYAMPPGQSGNMGSGYTMPPGQSGNMGGGYAMPPGQSGNMSGGYAMPPGQSGNMSGGYSMSSGQSGNMGGGYAMPPGPPANMGSGYTMPPGQMGGGYASPPAQYGNMGNAYAASPGNNFPQDDYLANACSDGRYYRWTRMPIRVAIASGSGVPGYRDAFPQVLRDAFAKWAAASENRISFVFVQSPSQADICCDWTGNPSKLAEGGQAVEGGLTKLSGQPQSNGDVSINSARITILTNRSGQSLNDDDMKKVCLHEVGHALGINGHSNNNTDIMFFSESSTVWPSLTKRDKATICRLYANYPRQASGRN